MNTDPFNTNLNDLPFAVGRVPHCFITALSQEGIPYVAQDSARTDPAARFYLYDARLEQRPRLLAGQTAINVRGLHVMDGIDALELLTDTRAMRAEWLVQDWNVQETVAAIDRRAVRQGLMRAIQSHVEQAGGIWARLSAYPYPYQSAFNFRLDCDEDAPPDFHAVLDAEAGFEDCFSHYVCGEAYQRQPSALARQRSRFTSLMAISDGLRTGPGGDLSRWQPNTGELPGAIIHAMTIHAWTTLERTPP